MRLSTSLMYSISAATMTNKQKDMSQLYQQIAQGKRVLRPGDDPLAASLAINVSQSQAVNTQYGKNRDVAERNLQTSLEALDSVYSSLTTVSTKLVNAGNGSLSPSDLRSLSAELKEVYASLYTQANATDGNGHYIFSGNQGQTPAYEVQNGWVVGDYQGGNQPRTIQVDQTRQMPSSNLGSEIFERANPGSRGVVATVATGAGTANSTLVAGHPVLPSGGATNNNTYTVVLDSVAGTYDVRQADGTTSVVPPISGAYDASTGVTVTLPNNVKIQLEGEPGSGGTGNDVVTVAPIVSSDVDMNMFTTLKKAIDALDQVDTDDAASVAVFRNAMNEAGAKLSNNFDNVLTIRASIGARMNELTALDTNSNLRALSYSAQMTSLEGSSEMDMVEMYSMLLFQSNAFEASMLAFQRIQGLSLLNSQR
ncbi:flagellar hook-associated protein FlgL [Corticimicrobacter populi]|uniref:Flagellar hook-associated protein 3 n=1 Tax=Corticimicrobacter populi TaxID=2175229 RepID=A0A2V1JY05_9BURK|nr:flagellar hook-associated protein FlgL [Corticimicrobacter populi]PWF21187.1 flagellar hook-associated protein 3 [Corticimicrobacter populi]